MNGEEFFLGWGCGHRFVFDQLARFAQVAQRHEAAHRRHPLEVVGRRRRGRRPLERVAPPRVVAGDLAVRPAADDVDEEQQDRERDQEGRDR